MAGHHQKRLAFGALLAEGIGDTIRVSLSAPPVEEVKVGCKLLEYMGLRPRKFDIISCPSCGRSQVDVIQLANAVTEGLKDVTAPIRVAVMGCIVNGPGEAREADLGVASGNGKGQIFIKGKVIQTVPEDQIVETLLVKAQEIAAQMEATDRCPSTPQDRWWCRWRKVIVDFADRGRSIADCDRPPAVLLVVDCHFSWSRYNERRVRSGTSVSHVQRGEPIQSVDEGQTADGQSAYLHHPAGHSGVGIQFDGIVMEVRANRSNHRNVIIRHGSDLR